MRLFGYLLLLLLIIYGLWPYYSLYRLEGALLRPDDTELAILVDLPAIRANYKHRIAAGINTLLGPINPQAQGLAGWIRQGAEQLGERAIEGAITLGWVRETLRHAVSRITGQDPPYLLQAVEFAFFESPDRFLVRLGRLGENAVHLRLTRIGGGWRLTDII